MVLTTQLLTTRRSAKVVFDVFLIFVILAVPLQYELLGLAFYRTGRLLALRIFETLIALTETVVNYALITKVNITRINTLQAFSPASAKILHSHLVIIYAVLIALILHIWPIGVMGMYMVLIPFYPLF